MNIRNRLAKLERNTTTANNDTMKLILLVAPEQQVNGLSYHGEQIERLAGESLDALQQRAIARWYTGQSVICVAVG